MTFDDLSPELKAKVKECKTGAELAALAEREGIKLTIEQLDAVAGGDDDSGEWVCGGYQCRQDAC